jgi:hypothetical protein
MRINDVMGLLVSTYIEWNHVLANPKFIRKGRVITWRDYSSARLAIPESYLDVAQLYEGGRYSFQTTDGSLLQIYYSYPHSNDELAEARLAFYKVDEHSWEFEEPNEAEDTDELVRPIGHVAHDERAIRPSGSINWVRIDYSPRSAGGVLHTSCHLHISAFPSARVVVAGVPTPKQFVEFVMALCYPDIYSKHRLDANGDYKEPAELATVNADCVPFREDIVFGQITHLRIPGVLPAHAARITRGR